MAGRRKRTSKNTRKRRRFHIPGYVPRQTRLRATGPDAKPLIAIDMNASSHVYTDKNGRRHRCLPIVVVQPGLKHRQEPNDIDSDSTCSSDDDTSFTTDYESEYRSPSTAGSQDTSGDTSAATDSKSASRSPSAASGSESLRWSREHIPTGEESH